jgi:hypothetical protein
MEGVKYHIKGLMDNNCIIGACPQIYEIVKTECGIGACPQIYGIVKTECVAIGCPTIFNDPENKDVYLIVGKQMKPEEFEGLAGKVGVGEAVIAVPKSLVDKLSELK